MELFVGSAIVVLVLAVALQAQTNTVIPCCSVPVSSIPASLRQSWCDTQENTCVDLCGGQGDIASNGNTCDSSTLDYSCNCSNGTTIADDTMKTYQQTVPAQMCYFWYDACINATISSDGSSNAAQQLQCTQARNSQCGNLTVDESSSGSSSASRSASLSLASSRTLASLPSAPSTTSSSPPFSTSSSLTTSTFTSSPPPLSQDSASQQKGLSTGAIAGIVIGVAAGIAIGIAIWWFYRRSRRPPVAGPQERASVDHADFEDKQVVTSSISDFPSKAELHGNAYVPELEGSQRYRSHELHNSSSPSARIEERLGDGPGVTSSPSLPDADVQQPVHTALPLYGQASQHDIHGTDTASKKATDGHVNTQDDIAALEEEERRIDAEMTEVRRMRELRDQKYAIQQKLRQAKSAGPFEM